jgi:hypothetical protein
MNINGIRNDGGAAISALLTLNNNSQSTASSDASAASASSPASSSSVSKPGELLAKLSQLLQQDPAKFKQVTQQISDELKSQAQGASGPQAQFLSKLSDNFAQASSTGSLSSLQPTGDGRDRGEHTGAASAHHHHGGHHGGGGAGGIESVLSKALDEVNQALSTSSTSTSAATANPASSG